MLGLNSKRELRPVEENDRHEVNVHSKNDKNIPTKSQETNTSADTGRAGSICCQLSHGVFSERSASHTAKYTDRIVDVPVVMQRQVTTIQTVQKQRQVLVIQKVQNIVQVQQVQCSVRVVDVPVIKEQQVPTNLKTVQKSISELDV